MEAEKAGALLRDRDAWHERDAFEPCDLVMGKQENVPPPYAGLWADPGQKDELARAEAAKSDCAKKPSKRNGKNAADR